MQGLYSWMLTGNDLQLIAQDIHLAHPKEKLDEAYFLELLHSIPKCLNEIDVSMIPFLKIPINELCPIELTVLRIAFYELIYQLNIPYRVVINEAMELVKTFGSIGGHKFVNGVLDAAVKKLRSAELKN